MNSVCIFWATGALGPTVIWIVILWVIFYTAVIAVFVRHVGEVLRTLLEERDPQLKEILRQTLLNLLELIINPEGGSRP